MMLGTAFEREIREQPESWERVARSDAAARLARELEEGVVFVGSGSSFFAAQLGALALRRRGYDAHALAATESQADRNAFQDRVVVALSQSGTSSDLLAALRQLRPRRIVALTNTPRSPLGDVAASVIDVAAGPELAIPASKSVSTTVAILLGAASLLSGEHGRDAAALLETSREVRAWLASDGVAATIAAAGALARREHILVLGTDYGAPVAREAALKFKEAAYLHAEGFAAGEFRHGSSAIVDAGSAVIGIVDRDGRATVERPLADVEATGALRLAIGTVEPAGVERLGPVVADAYNALAWLTTAQLLALYAARARGVDSDAPRGLRKALISE